MRKRIREFIARLTAPYNIALSLKLDDPTSERSQDGGSEGTADQRFIMPARDSRVPVTYDAEFMARVDQAIKLSRQIDDCTDAEFWETWEAYKSNGFPSRSSGGM